jgi:hypothetical protein
MSTKVTQARKADVNFACANLYRFVCGLADKIGISLFRNIDDLGAFIIPAERTDTMRKHRLLALGAGAHGRRCHLPMGAAFAAAGFGMLAFW